MYKNITRLTIIPYHHHYYYYYHYKTHYHTITIIITIIITTLTFFIIIIISSSTRLTIISYYHYHHHHYNKTHILKLIHALPSIILVHILILGPKMPPLESINRAKVTLLPILEAHFI